jgi:uncharacterized protein YbaP (TraB family)
MPGWTARLFSPEPELRMVWEVSWEGRRSRLVGTAQFLPRHFRGALGQLIQEAHTVVVEAPLDEASLRKVVDAGAATVQTTLYHALDQRALLRVCRMLGVPVVPRDVHEILRQALFGRPDQWLEDELRAVKPWMGFFGLWTRFRSQLGGCYSLDLDAARTAGQRGRPLKQLETIDEQIAVLDAIPLERIVTFIAEVDWHAYYDDYVRRYLDGDLQGLIAAARVFPTFCEAVLGARDARLADRLLPALEAGDACAFVGIAHVPGMISRLQARGCEVFHPMRG